ncbi:tectonic-3 [Sphaeramia orbicularis]|uniref:Uncharacterized protein n=1 Tax=Sphaeramia orbicularis TaxID=375764 RepID=A0A673CUX0_9TELE|nr:tectonic-3 [Sphaeramia orbicularis]
MDYLRWCRTLLLFIILCEHLANAVTDSGVTSSGFSSPAPGQPFSSPTPAPGGATAAAESTSVGVSTTEEVTVDPMDTTMLTVSEAPTVVTPTPAVTTVPPVVIPDACLCDLTPGFCDLGCCCDTDDCGATNLSTVFTGCPQKPISGVCIEKWLIFRANVDSSLVTVTDSLFCVKPQDKASSPPALLRYPALDNSHHFAPPQPATISHSRDFYRVDDVIQTYFTKASVRGLLRQPSPSAAATFCTNRNPAKFLRSASLSCTRSITLQSCITDPNLNARSYFSDLSLVKIPVAETVQVSDLLIPVTPLFDWPEPSQQNTSCINVVEKVELVITYTGRGELSYASVNIVLATVDPDQLLLQTHSVQFQLATPSPSPGPVIPAVGLKAGSPLIGRFDDTVKPLTTLGMSQGGVCSSDPSRRTPILFTHNTISGCTFSSPSSNCSELRLQIYGVLQGLAIPDVVAMNSGPQPDWTRVLTNECPVGSEETCDSGCTLPHSLTVQVLWARQGLLALPQSYILGAKYLFKCRSFKCPVSSPLTLTSQVMFADTTVYPEPPRGSPQPQWKFPFGFFTRGTAELDGHIVLNGSDTVKITWSLMLFSVMLLTGLQFLCR